LKHIRADKDSSEFKSAAPGWSVWTVPPRMAVMSPTRTSATPSDPRMGQAGGPIPR